MKIGRLALRTVVGGLFVGHGTQKLFGWFDGNGLEETAQGFDAMGLKPGRINAIIAGTGEAAGGAAFAAGYRTPLAAAPIVGSMLMAIKHVHGKNGPWSHKGGYEYNLVLTAAVLAIVEAGPGPVSLDALRGKEKQGLAWALVALGLGAGGVAAVEKLAAVKAPAAEAPAPAAPAAPAAPVAPVTPVAPAAPAASTPPAAESPVAAAEPVTDPTPAAESEAEPEPARDSEPDAVTPDTTTPESGDDAVTDAELADDDANGDDADEDNNE